VKLQVATAPPPFWDDFVAAHGGSLFQSRRWEAVLEHGYGGSPLYSWLSGPGGARLGVLGVIIDLVVCRIFYAALPVGGLLGDRSLIREALPLLERELRKRGVHQAQLIEPNESAAISDSGYSAVRLPRHIVDLSDRSVEDVWRAVRPQVRNKVTQSQKRGVEIELLREANQIPAVFDLYLRTMRANDAAAKYPIGRFESIFEHLVGDGLGCILVAKHQGRVIGSNTLVCSPDAVHDIQLSYDPAALSLRPNDALVFASLKWTIESGRTKFDFLSSPADDTSLQRYKAKWLADEHSVVTYIKDLDPVRASAWRICQRALAHPLGARAVRLVRKQTARGARVAKRIRQHRTLRGN
jgi:hypothetical protein